MDMQKHAADFQRNTAEHKTRILMNNGLYRHVVCAKPKTSAYHFGLITWPGYLTIYGDCGCYTFSRLDDMFEFFRGERINPSYWAEKVRAADKSSGIKAWSPECFAAVVREHLADWIAGMDDDDADDLRTLVEEGIDSHDQDEHAALEWMRDFDHNGYQFIDYWDHNFHEYTHQFIWCLHAIVWAISQYDNKEEHTCNG